MNKEYYYLDIDLNNMKIVGFGKSETATLNGNTGKPNIHRIFLTKGQYNKMKNKIG